eukprot:TRINITY_DN204_c0_g2_i1.p1 TRINITY_DN204_c0_g2~~TRINITY_DN204_c0_g2_i1.p1  ORF type:complete len:1244 (+),score=415.59 TRINITY_DN204_c0_g2_i1:43-3774(+)
MPWQSRASPMCRYRAVAAAVVAMAARAHAWDETCIPCQPSGNLESGLCLADTPDMYFVNFKTTTNGRDCPGGCSAIGNKYACARAAKYLRLGMNGDPVPPGTCPTTAEMEALWTAKQIGEVYGGPWKSTIVGCSWNGLATDKLVFNSGGLGTGFNSPLVTGQADAIQSWQVCHCTSAAAMPDYVPVTSGNVCPDTRREVDLGQHPTCGFLTTERDCEAAAAALVPDDDVSLEYCVSNCNSPGNEVKAQALNNVEIGPERPAGCHFRPNDGSIYDDALWFNEHYNRSRIISAAYARPVGTGHTPDFLFCGCGAKVPHLPTTRTSLYGFTAETGGAKRWYSDCGDMDGSSGLSRMCGHGQKCDEGGNIGNYTCACKYSKDSKGDPVVAFNQPAECDEEIPIKYVAWPSGTSCPFDMDSQCLPPPTQKRCELAAARLGLVPPDTRASLPHSNADRSELEGCHFKYNSGPDQLWWNALGSNATSGTASFGDFHICECKKYPQYVPMMAGSKCDDMTGCSDPATAGLCGAASDSVGIAKVSPPQTNEAWLPAEYATQGGAAKPTLSGCRVKQGATELVWLNNVSGSSANSTPDEFRLCDCTDVSHPTIAQLYGFRHVGVGDCVGSVGPTCPPGAGAGNCINSSNTSDVFVRADRYSCIGLNMDQCVADHIVGVARVCDWNDTSNACEWHNQSAVNEGEMSTANFEACVEICLLLCNCTGLHFYVEDGDDPNGPGGCDFFRGPIVTASGESVFTNKHSGTVDCYENVPKTPAPTAAPPDYKCPECNPLGEGDCRGTWGCRWSSVTQFCCCDPFITACTNSWHTNTSTKPQCESVSEDGVQCKWYQRPELTAFPQAGLCELPIDDCVDELMTVQVDQTNPVCQAQVMDEATFCTNMIAFMQTSMDFQLIRRPCVSETIDFCNITTSGTVATVKMAFNLVAVDRLPHVSCGRATRIANAHRNKWLAMTNPLPFGVSTCNIIDVDPVSKCWYDCSQDPKCPKEPTAAPTPNTLTQPPSPPLNNPNPTGSPTASPSYACPTLDSSTDDQAVQCFSENFDHDTQPWRNRNYTYCGRTPKEFFTDSCHYECTHCVDEPGLQINITCPAEWHTCEMFLLVYHERTCTTNGTSLTNGGWLTNAPGEGWVENRCGPEFCTNRCAHNMINLYKQVPGGEVGEVPKTTSVPTMYFTLIVKRGYECTGLLSQGTCDGVGLCKWNGTFCNSEWCPAKVGPPGVREREPCCAPGTPEGNCSAI